MYIRVQPHPALGEPSETIEGSFAGTILPTVLYCGPKDWGDVFNHLKMAVDSVARANDRLKLMTVVNRLSAWASGPEQTWFGDFRQEHFEKLSKNMQQIYDILRNRGSSILGFEVRHMELSPFHVGSASEKTQAVEGRGPEMKPSKAKGHTLDHEAAHIAGKVIKETGYFTGLLPAW